ncbi:MAG: hypothetical protein U5L03_13865 [Burkholderiaceae bacterium]|nr:hypothetical protein [Burkholderiaceae bacterium]
MKTLLLAPRRLLVVALCGAALALASVTPARAAEAMRESLVPPSEPIQRHYDDVNYIARHSSIEQQREVRLAVLRAPGSKPPPHLREIGDRIARVEAAVAEVDTGIVGRSPPLLTVYAPTEVVAIKGAAPLLRVRVRVTDVRGQTRDEVHVWERTPRGWIRRAGAFVLLDR